MRYKISLAVALAFVAVAFCLECLRPNEGLPRSRKMEDGSVLTVEAVSVGTNLRYHEATPKAWPLAIGQRLPYALAAGLGWRFNTQGWMNMTMPNGMTAMGIFTAHEGPGSVASGPMRVVVLDREGNSFGWHEGGGSDSGTDQTHLHYHQLQSWLVPAFPRRDKTVVVRFLRKQGDGKADVPVMQFRIANPQPGPYPTWTPEPWPATNNAGDLAVTLTDFTTGLSKSQPARAALENEEVVTRLALDLQENGRTNCPWQVKSVEVSDATGNRWNSYLRDAKNKTYPSGLTSTMTLPGNLWPGESAWKLRIELSPTSNIPPDELATLTGIALPPEGSNSPLSLATNLGGFSFRLQKIETKKPSGNTKRPALTVSISYEIKGMPEDCHLSVVKVCDEQGRKVQINGSKELSPRGDSFDLAVPTNAVSLNCTLGVRKSRFAQFIAKPRTL